MDAVLLSQFVTTRPGARVVDLGAGCGVIGLMLLRTRDVQRVICLEIQPGLADQAFRNAALNGLEGRMTVILGDIRHPPLLPSIADVVVCNPPYRPPGSGKTNPDPEKAIARHEIMASLNDVLSAACRLLKPKGRITMVYPAARLAELLVKMRSFDFEPKKMRIKHPDMRGEAKLVFIEATRGGKAGLKILPPLLDQGD
jgi:tRNA1Val (adenine37-N6)-methyltransferase